MKVYFSPVALKQIQRILDYIKQKNTEGSDVRWLSKFTSFVYSYAKPNVTYTLCKHYSLSPHNYQCIAYNDWIIAFRINGDKFDVRRIIHGSRLS